MFFFFYIYKLAEFRSFSLKLFFFIKFETWNSSRYSMLWVRKSTLKSPSWLNNFSLSLKVCCWKLWGVLLLWVWMCKFKQLEWIIFTLCFWLMKLKAPTDTCLVKSYFFSKYTWFFWLGLTFLMWHNRFFCPFHLNNVGDHNHGLLLLHVHLAVVH